MSVVKWEKKETVAIITMTNKENRQNLVFANEMVNAFDEIIKDTSIFSVILTSSDEKNFSQGVDVPWLLEKKQANDLQAMRDFMYRMNDVFKRILLFPMPVIAAINGHAFGNGAILSCACDFRFMRADKGFFCFPEVDISIPFLPGMVSWVKRAIPYYKFEDMLYSGKRITAPELAEHHVIVKACKDLDDLMTSSFEFAKTFQKKRGIFGEMKKRNHKEIVRIIENEDPEFIEPLNIMVP
ncbi:MAG: enoyl-CoA hydratase/isomerase family protein [Spirochaetes bacterium]|jgi:enoyl-CoA hydratase/carnithine racemase|nr:enoyl-CoA hydratase/isomerase family protein [Spirochaetota bacterium]